MQNWSDQNSSKRDKFVFNFHVILEFEWICINIVIEIYVQLTSMQLQVNQTTNYSGQIQLLNHKEHHHLMRQQIFISEPFWSLFPQIVKMNLIYDNRSRRNYMIAMMSNIFLGSILEDLWWRILPSGPFVLASLRGGAVTGRVGNELDQKGSNILRSLWRTGPAFEIKIIWYIDPNQIHFTIENQLVLGCLT